MLRIDSNLIWIIVNLLIFYFLIRKFLFKPVLNIIEKRKQMVAEQFEKADTANAEFAHVSMRSATDLAAIIFADLELRFRFPFFNQCVGRTLLEFVGARLVGDAHDAVAVDQRGDNLAHQRHGQLEAGGAFQTAHVYGDDGHLLQTGFLERFAQQIDVVAGAAAAAGLGDNQRDLIDVVFAGVQRV